MINGIYIVRYIIDYDYNAILPNVLARSLKQSISKLNNLLLRLPCLIVFNGNT